MASLTSQQVEMQGGRGSPGPPVASQPHWACSWACSLGRSGLPQHWTLLETILRYVLLCCQNAKAGLGEVSRSLSLQLAVGSKLPILITSQMAKLCSLPGSEQSDDWVHGKTSLNDRNLIEVPQSSSKMSRKRSNP